MENKTSHLGQNVKVLTVSWRYMKKQMGFGVNEKPAHMGIVCTVLFYGFVDISG
jgi:hypothetical protein